MIEKINLATNNIAILGALTQNEIEYLLKFLNRKNYSKGEIVYCQNSSPENIYIVEVGTVQMKINTDFKNNFSKTYNIGDCFGQTALLGIIPNIGECIALSDVTLLELSKFSFHKLSKENNQIFVKLLLNLTREICRYNHYIINKSLENR
ncbi:cyclic nucleotide-binding domain-containing protein [Fusobacterium sp.]|uniref:cyclic nucleotide-binding domain-containing protein n=1 Tax=Fusobacterium sp. TaxID=68766 RepID=UPI00262F4216|nr:cyclic nucleotide-binding domain-containing protein [Fusobacterium sp.]